MIETLTALLRRYLAASTRIRKPATRVHYERSVRQFSAHLGHEATTEDLTDDAIAGWLHHVVDDEGLTEATANQRAKQIRALWTWAARRRIVDAWPTVRGLVEPEGQPRAYSLAEVERILDACRQCEGWIGQHHASDWWEALHCFLWDSGERIGATLQLRREHLDLDAGVARVPARIRKGGRHAMTYRLRPSTIACLRRLLATPTDTGLVFDRHWKDVKSIYGAYHRMLSAAGIPVQRRETGFQKLRRTVLTHVELQGGDATAFARHSSRRVTEESYLDQSLLAERDRHWPIEPEAAPKSWWRRLLR